MARNIGTVFVELQLDSRVYREKLSEVQTGAVATAKGVETAWKALGTKSSEYFDQQRRAAQNAYTLIKDSAHTATQDITRAHEAMTRRIKELNDQQAGGASKAAAGFLQMSAAMATGTIAADVFKRAMSEAFNIVKDSITLAARVETLGVVLTTVGKMPGILPGKCRSMLTP